MADEAVEGLRSEWAKLDRQGSGKPSQQDVAQQVWEMDQPGINGEHNMPKELPPRLQRKVTDTMERIGSDEHVDFTKWANEELEKQQIGAEVKPPEHKDAAFDVECALDSIRGALPEVNGCGKNGCRCMMSVYG